MSRLLAWHPKRRT